MKSADNMKRLFKSAIVRTRSAPDDAVFEKVRASYERSMEDRSTQPKPIFGRFVEWQYKTLQKKGYVVKGTHPVVWCPHDSSPTGDHDRYEGEGVAPEEFTLIMFKHNDSFLPAATFRPETIYGATNLWLNPDADYVEAQVDKEKWIISGKAAEKLREQKKKITIIRQFKGRELIGSYVTNPLLKI